MATGPFFELTRLIEDETEVRASAYRAIRTSVDRSMFTEVEELAYNNPVKHPDFDAFRERVLLVDVGRARRMDAREGALREVFHRVGKRAADGGVFDQPSRVNVLRLAPQES